MNDDDLIYVIGDFNLPNVSWTSCADSIGLLPGNLRNETEFEFIDVMLFNELQQVNGYHNCYGRLLDLIFTNVSSDLRIHEVSKPLVKNDLFHKSVEIAFKIDDKLVFNNSYCERFYNFNNADFISLNNYLQGCNWDEMIEMNNIDDKDWN